MGAAEIVRIDEHKTRVSGIQAGVIQNRTVEQMCMVGGNDDGDRFRLHDQVVFPHFVKTHTVGNSTGITGAGGNPQEHSFRVGIVGGSMNLPCGFRGKSEFAHVQKQDLRCEQ